MFLILDTPDNLNLRHYDHLLVYSQVLQCIWLNETSLRPIFLHGVK